MTINPPRPKGPPLNAMRAFEAAARHQSYVLAAHELSVSPGAISQHIKTLESWSGVPLFKRNAKGVELTQAGRSLTKLFTAAFDAVSDAAHDLRNLSSQVEIHIAALPSVAQLWLPKRLGAVRAAFPNIRFSVTAIENPPNLTREMFDLGLFLSDPEKQPETQPLAPDMIIPVCAPWIAKHIASPRDLNTATLLQDHTWNTDWQMWSKHMNIDLRDASAGPGYSLYSLAVEEAKSGAGVLMGHTLLIETALTDGTLVPVCSKAIPSGLSLSLSMSPQSRRRKEVNEVAKMLKEMATHS